MGNVVKFPENSHLERLLAVEIPGFLRLWTHHVDGDSDVSLHRADLIQESGHLRRFGDELLELSDVAFVQGHALLGVLPRADGERLRRTILGLHILDAGLFGFDRFRCSTIPKTVGEIEHDQRDGDHRQSLFLFRIVGNQRHFFAYSLTVRRSWKRGTVSTKSSGGAMYTQSNWKAYTN